MRKKYFYLTLMLIIFLLSLNIKVEATGTCTTSELNELKTEASNMTFSYEVVTIEDEHTDDNMYYYNLSLTNLTENFYALVGFYDYRVDYVYTEDGIIDIENAFYGGGYTSKIKIYASSKTNCKDELVKTITINLPYYNKYSEYEECIGYEELEICNSTSNTEKILTDEQFLTLLETEKAEATNEQEDEKSKDENILNKIIDFCLEYKMIIFPVAFVIIVLIIIILIVVIKQRKQKIKIDLGGKL